MPEPTQRELYDIINEMRVDIGVMNTKMDFVMDSKKTAERAEQKADKALQKTDDIEKRLDAMNTTIKWAVGLTVTSVLSVVGLIISIAF